MPLTMKSFWFLESNALSNLSIFGNLQSAGDTPEVKKTLVGDVQKNWDGVNFPREGVQYLDVIIS